MIKKKNKKIIIMLIILFVIIVSLFLFNAYYIKKLKANVISNYLVNSSDNLVSFTLEKYDLENGFKDLETKKLSVNVQFKNENSKNKKIVINLKEGMTYKAYPVLEVSNSTIQNKIDEQDNLFKAISSVDTPFIYNYSNISDLINNISFGDLTYNIYDNISSVNLNINIAIDSLRYYGEKNINDAITISVYEDDELQNSISSDIMAKNADKFSLKLTNYHYYETKNLYPSLSENLSIGKTFYSSVESTKYLSDTQHHFTYIPYYKKIEYYLYYPLDTTFVDTASFSALSSDFKVTNYSDYSMVKVESENYSNINYGIGVSYKVNEDASYVLHEAPDYNKIIITYYDGTTKEYVSNLKTKIDVLDPSSFVNQMDVYYYDTYDDDKQDTFMYGPMFVITNTTPKDKTNQTLEFEIDPNYEAVKVNFPFDTKVATISNIKYKTNKTGDEWISYDKIHNKTTFSKQDAGYKTGDGVYFTAVKATISLYKEGYTSSVASPKSSINAVVYGNLKGNTSYAYVTFSMYDEKDKENTLISKKGTVYKTEEKSVAPLNNNSTLKFDKKVVNAGDTFTTSGTLRVQPYFYGTVNYVDNAQIYIRQPKGITINTNSIVLKDYNNNEIKYTITKHTNKYNEVIYVVNTNYIVGNYLTEDLLSNAINFSFSSKVNLDCELPSINSVDFISWGNKEINYLVSIRTDNYDFDGDKDYDDQVFMVTNTNLSILPSKSFDVLTYVLKDGVESSPYDPENESTIINLNYKEDFSYNIKIKNNSETTIDKFELYLPIPKQDDNYGLNFQSADFKWNMSLKSTINLPDNYHVEYLTNKIDLNTDINKIEFKKQKPDDLSSVRMIKIVSDTSITASEEINISIPIKVNEKRKDITDKQGLINALNPVYYVSSSGLQGTFSGSGVGIRLIKNEISGKIFYDNNGNGIFDDEIDEYTSNVKVSLYKLNSEERYEYLDVEALYDLKEKEYYIDDYVFKENEIYGLKFDIPVGYYPSTTDKDGWIKNITINNLENNNIGLLKYNLSFDVENEIIAIDEESIINIKNISPVYFDYIKDDIKAYKWELKDINDLEYLIVEDSNLPYTKIKGIKKKDEVIVKVTIYDKYDNSYEKEFKVKITDDASPNINADDVTIYVGNKIEFEKYVNSAQDYKLNDIELIWQGENKNIEYQSDIPMKDGIATKTGAYNVTYTLTYNGVKKSKTIKIIVDDKKGIINPSTSDTLSIIIIILISVMILYVALIRFFKK